VTKEEQYAYGEKVALIWNAFALAVLVVVVVVVVLVATM
jgi:heme exporter protein D